MEKNIEKILISQDELQSRIKAMVTKKLCTERHSRYPALMAAAGSINSPSRIRIWAINLPVIL